MELCKIHDPLLPHGKDNDEEQISSTKNIRADTRFVLSQWETALLCNDVFHWLGASLEYDSNDTPTKSEANFHLQEFDNLFILQKFIDDQ